MVLVLVRVIAGGHLAWLQPFRQSGGCASAVTPFRHPEATLRRKLGVWFAVWTATEYPRHRSWPICLWRGQIMQGSKKDVVGSDWVIQPSILPRSKNWVPASAGVRAGMSTLRVAGNAVWWLVISLSGVAGLHYSCEPLYRVTNLMLLHATTKL